ncbi:hypothetical protein Tco_0346967 [Tanacetum coccineum]
MMNNKFKGGLLGLEGFKMILRVIVAQLLLLVEVYCSELKIEIYAKCTAGTKVNAAGLKLLERLRRVKR